VHSEAAATTATAASEAAAPSAPLAGRPRILVVDDNEDAAGMLDATLSLLGCDVRVARDGPEALRVASHWSFDAALLDIGLPVMDGYELAGRLREMANAVQLVAVTGYGQESDRQRAIAAGFHKHLVKPVGLQALSTIVAGLQQARGVAITAP
jgi:CheY-like chemotaxis protein